MKSYCELLEPVDSYKMSLIYADFYLQQTIAATNELMTLKHEG